MISVSYAPDLGHEPPEWTIAAVCASTDPEAFFPEKGSSTRAAKRVCAGCPVINECLQYALDNGERFGVWGGLSERERHRLTRAAGPRKGRVREQGCGTPAGYRWHYRQGEKPCRACTAAESLHRRERRHAS